MKYICISAILLLLCQLCCAGPLKYTEGKALKTNVETGETVSLNEYTDARYKYAIVPCKKGDVFTIDANGGSIYLAWAFTDKNYKLLDKGGVQTHVRTVIKAPANAAFMITNDKGGFVSVTGKRVIRDLGIREVCLENLKVAAYLANTQYDTTDYTYTLVENYHIAIDERLDQPAGVVIDIPKTGGANGYTVTIADNPVYKSARVYEADKKQTRLTVYNLIPGRYYWYKIAAVTKDGASDTAEGIIKTTGSRRMIKADSVHNIRDFGGIRTCDGRTTRYGLIFRGGEMNNNQKITDEDRKELVENIGIRADIDFRGGSELKLDDEDAFNDLNTTPLGSEVLYSNLPIGGIGPDGGGMEGFTAVFRQLLDNLKNNRPTYLHCVGGADRTGCFFMFIGGILGVNENELLKDVELTTFSYYGSRHRTQEHYKLVLECPKSVEGSSYREKWINYAVKWGLTREEIEEFTAKVLD